MSPTVVYVHGNGNKARKEVLKEEWDTALFGQDMGRASRVAYFADLLYPAPLPEAGLDEVELVTSVPSVPESAGEAALDPAGLVTETLAEASAAPAGPESGAGDADGLHRWLQEMAYVADAVVQGEDQAAVTPGPEALPLPRRARIAAFRALVKVTFKDVYAYFFGGFKDRMRASLRAALEDSDGPLIVIGHSLGSIIAYDTLREPGQGTREIPLFVTVGSPLGVVEIQDLVEQGLRVPAGVGAWRNVADGRDLVALDRTIRPEYDPEHRCTDFLVVNDSPNHHGIRQYLSSRPVRESVQALFA